jgi:hypothetical protein
MFATGCPAFGSDIRLEQAASPRKAASSSIVIKGRLLGGSTLQET